MGLADHVAAMRAVLEAHGVTNLPHAVLLDLAKAAPAYGEHWTDEQVAAYVGTIEPETVRQWAFRHDVPRVRMMPAEKVRDVVQAIRENQAARPDLRGVKRRRTS